MNKAKINYIVDFLAFISFVVTAVTGLAIFFFMPSGIRQGRLQEFIGIQKGTWSAAHDWFGIIFVILVIIHFFLHWNWVVCMTKNFFKAEKCEIEKK
jgi:cytochrome b subunit of formate dehydrogenase